MTSSTDHIVALIKFWISTLGEEAELGAWAVDEYKAYRQIPVREDQRRYAVVAVVNPNVDKASGRPNPRLEYFAMNGSSFGLTNAV